MTETNKYYTDLLEGEADHYASNYSSMEDYKKVYDAALHGCKFGFEERQKEVDLLEKAHDITIQQLTETQDARNRWREMSIKLAEEMRKAEWDSPLYWEYQKLKASFETGNG